MYSRVTSRELFEQLILLPPAERASMLETIGTEDGRLRIELERLLAADDAANADPDAPAAPPAHVRVIAKAWAASGETATPISIAGHRVVRRIGSGGMGVVFEVDRPNGEGRAALKILHPGLCSGPVLERFRYEVGALDRCNHHYVARVHSHGHIDQGLGAQPYLVMDLADGVPLSRAAPSMSLRTRIGFLVKLCDGVSHIHSRGVIHGDLKPANVIVRPGDAPRIVDFGMARLAAACGDASVTAWSAVGSLQYMSPEQLGLGTAGVDERADIYALGMIAYEVLSGRRPYELENKTLGQALSIVATARMLPLQRRAGRPWADLDRIVRRALQRRPCDRYRTVNDLRDDLDRVANGARAPRIRRSPVLRFRVRQSRRVWLRTIMFLIALAMPIGIAGTVPRDASVGGGMPPAAPIPGSIELGHFARSDYPRHAEEVLARRIGLRASRNVSDLVEVFRFYGSAGRLLDSLDFADEIIAGNDKSITPEALSCAYLMRAQALYQLGRVNEAQAGLMDAYRHAVAAMPAVGANELMLSSMSGLAIRLGDLDTAEKITREQIRILAQPGRHALRTRTMLAGRLAVILLLRGDTQAYQDAIHEHTDGLARNGCGPEPAWFVLRDSGRYVEVGIMIADILPVLEAASDPESGCLLGLRGAAHRDLGSLAWRRGDFESAQVEFERAVQLYGRAGDGFALSWAECIQSVGVCLRDQGRLAEAESHLRESLRFYEERLTDHFARLADSLITLARLLYFKDELDEAESLARRAAEIRSRTVGVDHVDAAETDFVLGLILLEQGSDLSEAETLLTNARTRRLAKPGIEDWFVAESECGLARLRMRRGEFKEAQELLTQALPIFQAFRGHDHPLTQRAQRWLHACRRVN